MTTQLILRSAESKTEVVLEIPVDDERITAFMDTLYRDLPLGGDAEPEQRIQAVLAWMVEEAQQTVKRLIKRRIRQEQQELERSAMEELDLGIDEAAMRRRANGEQKRDK